VAAGATSVMLAGLATAQEEFPVEESQKLEEVVVTGSLIRGVEAIGSQTLGLDKQDMTEIGATTTNELLASIPQVSNYFNQRADQDPRGAARLQVNRPNLRNLPGINSATGATTLVLVDGHRMAPVGTDQSSVDPDIIPQNVIERVEVITDGGSSLYGADAVGGVINFNTLNEFEGVQLDLGYDTGDDFDSWQGAVLAGTKWSSGSGYISLATTDQDVVQNENRDWAASGNWDKFGSVLTPSGTECLEPVGAVTTWFWYGGGWTNNPAAPGAGVKPVGDPCDINGKSALLPKQTRDNLYAGITQEITDKISLDTKAYYMKRNTRYSRYPEGDTVGEPSPSEQGIVGENVGDLFDTAQVGFSYGANEAYQHRETEIDLEPGALLPS
jgi:iron complex outermembrane receptor protein